MIRAHNINTSREMLRENVIEHKNCDLRELVLQVNCDSQTSQAEEILESNKKRFLNHIYSTSGSEKIQCDITNTNKNARFNNYNGDNIQGHEESQTNLSRNHFDRKPQEFDDILPLAGEFGLYQVFLIIITVPFFFMYAFLYYGQIFMTTTSENHWCWIPELSDLTVDARRNLAIPADTSRFGYSRCSMYLANWSEVIASGIKPVDSEVVPCQNGWEFGNEIPYTTISSEYGWVCDKDNYKASAQSIFFAGSIVGGFFIGWIADAFGRVPAMALSCLLALCGGIATVFSKSFLDFSLYRFLSGMANDNIIIMVYVLVLEYTAPKYRTLMANVPMAIFYSLAACLLPFISLACSDWRIFSLAISVPFVFGLFAPLFVPESPRWYLSKGRVDNAIEKLLLVGKLNRKEVPVRVVEDFRIYAKIPQENNNTKAEPIVLVTRPILRRLFFIICLLFLFICLIFDGLVRTVDQLGVDIFLSFTLATLTEVPSLILIVFVLDRLGRRWLCIICMGICCIFSILAAVVPAGIPSVVCAVAARFVANMTYNIAMQWAVELLPTSVRGTGVAVMHVFGYIGNILSPYVAYLNTFVEGLPLLVLGIVAGLGTVLALLLPETTGKDMPQSVEESEAMVQNHKLLEPPVFMKK